MSIWFTEKQTKNFGITAKIKQTYVSEKTDYQDVKMMETEEWGNMLVLDDRVMTTEKDEFVYNEMMVHIPLFTHPNPRKILIVGGGDGGIIREVLKHPSVENATITEIDGKVIDYSKKYIPAIASEFDNERVEVKVEDGFMCVAGSNKEFDIIIVDSTEPVGPAVNLFSQGFYAGIYKALKDDGLFVAQTDNPWFKADLIKQAYRDVNAVFLVTKLYTANIPTYPSGMWTFTMGSKVHDPLKVEKERFTNIETKYYTNEIHFASFVLPKFVKDLTE